MKIRQCILKFTFDRPLNPAIQGKDIRGAIARLYPEETLFHHHDQDKLVYAYPQIQYKHINRQGIVVGLERGAEALGRIDLLGKKLFLSHIDYTVDSYSTSFEIREIGVRAEKQRYRFISPWLALNSDNYQRYQRLGSLQKKHELLGKILIGNILSLSKGIGYTVSEKIEVDFRDLKERSVRLKGTPMIAFQGEFDVNFDIPDFWGIGKSTSRGFGTVAGDDLSKTGGSRRRNGKQFF